MMAAPTNEGSASETANMCLESLSTLDRRMTEFLSTMPSPHLDGGYATPTTSPSTPIPELGLLDALAQCRDTASRLHSKLDKIRDLVGRL